MRYFLVVLLAFGLFRFPPLHRVSWLTGAAARAVVALGVGMLLSGVHHVVHLEHYVQVVPPWIPSPQVIVYSSTALRLMFGLGCLVPDLRSASTIGSLVLLCVVAPVNIRIAVDGIAEGQLLDADWFRWLRVVLHASWIAWCGLCLALLQKVNGLAGDK